MKNKEEVKLSKEDVVETLEAIQKAFEIAPEYKEKFDFTTFAKSLYGSAFNPWMQNDLMKSLNVSTATPSTREEIDEALANPMSNEDKLIQYNQGYYFSSLMFKRNQEYLANLPAFDLELSCINATEKDYESKTYKKDYQRVKEFLDKFDYRTEFRNVLWNLLMSETYYCMFRKFDSKYLLQTWPWNYAQISGRFEYGLLFDVDMRYFLQPSVDIDLFPNWCKKTYLQLFRDGKDMGYVPSNKMNKRTGKFATWAQTSPEDGFFCFKFNQNHNLQVPFFTAMLPEMAIIPLMRKLQVDQSFAAARKLLVSSIPYLKEKKSSSVVDQIAIDPDILGKFLALATQGLEKSIKVLSLPTEDIKGVEFQNTDQDTYKNFMSVTSSLLSGGKVIFAPNEKMNAIQTQVSLNLDELLAESIYPQFEDFLNYYINKETKKFKWRFKFVGSNDQYDRKRRQDAAFAYADKGVVLPNKIASSLGYNKIELERELEESKATKFTEKLQLMLNVNTMPNSGGNTGNNNNSNNSNNNTNSNDENKKNGRPQKEDNQLTDSGENTRSAASNVEKGGKI